MVRSLHLGKRLRRLGGGVWVVTAISTVVAGLLLSGAQSIAPPMFDPVGSAALPISLASALVFLSAVNIVAVLAPPQQENVHTSGTAWPFSSMPYLTFAMMAAYLAAMEIGLGFVIPTIAFLCAAIPIIGKSARLILPAATAAAILGPGLRWLLTSVFYVDLPRLFP